MSFRARNSQTTHISPCLRVSVRFSLCAFVPLCLCVMLLASCLQTGRPVRAAEFALGTVCTVTLFDQGQNARKSGVIFREIFSRIREIENLMSVNIPSSYVSRINAAAGIKPVQVHEDVFRVIKRALYFAELSGGAFDPTIGPLVSLWGVSGDNPRVPSQAEIDEILPLINWRNVELDDQQRSVFLKHPGMAFDLGGIAKGFAAGEAAQIAKNAGVKRAIIDLGGDIVTVGERRDGNPWGVAIQNPLERRGSYIGILRVAATTVVTSGISERFFEKDGVRYHHIFCPFSGFPADSGLLSVTITTANSMDADALSTAVFVLGFEKGKKLLELFPGTEAVFIFDDFSVRTTPGINFTH